MRKRADRLSLVFSALADPTRRAILARLAISEASVQDLAKPFKISLPAVSKHLRVLEDARLIRRGRTAQWRPCSLEMGPLKEAANWVDQCRKLWEEGIYRPDTCLRGPEPDDLRPKRKKGLKKMKKKDKKKPTKRK